MGILREFWKGFKVTGWIGLRGLFGKDIVTTRYPSEMREKPVRFHGRHVLNRYPDGMEKCIGCELCAGACPARCIYVRGADNPPDDPRSPENASGTCMRSTCCVASSAGCVWRPVRRRPSP